MDARLLAFKRLLDIMDDLRAKCPWDMKQSFQSLRKLTIEETYELAQAIDENNLEEIKKELGDLALHLVFYAKIGSEQNAFNITDVLNGICEKLIFRHPHIYGELKDVVLTDEDVKQNWESLKLKEGKTSILEGVPKALPAMTKANRIQEKVRAVGFDWVNVEQVLSKVEEEILELKLEIESGNKQKIKSELGDVLFSIINLSRFLDIDAEAALELTNKKFIHRFQSMESFIEPNGKTMSEMTLQELDELWDKAKKQEQ